MSWWTALSREGFTAAAEQREWRQVDGLHRRATTKPPVHQGPCTACGGPIVGMQGKKCASCRRLSGLKQATPKQEAPITQSRTACRVCQRALPAYAQTNGQTICKKDSGCRRRSVMRKKREEEAA